jgi:hypothetical protein
MNSKILFLYFLALFAICACNKDKINLKIVSPADGATFSKTQPIDVSIEASTKKGRINQVVVSLDTFFNKSLTFEPFTTTIPGKKITEKGLYPIAVIAYSSKGVKEGASIYINITE